MKPNVHPTQHQVLVQCVCNNEFYVYSSLETKVIHTEMCNKCHPAFTGKHQVITTAGRVDSFNSKFINFMNKNVQNIQNKKEVPAKTKRVTRKEQTKASNNQPDNSK